MPYGWTTFTDDALLIAGDLQRFEHVNELRTTVGRLEDNSLRFGTTAGTEPTYTLTLTLASPATVPGAYTDGMMVFARIHSTNASGAATLNVDGLGAKNIKKRDGSALAAGDLLAGNTYLMVYTVTEGEFRVIGPTAREVRVLNSQFADAGNVGAGEDNLQTFSVPAGTLAYDGDSLVVDMTFTCAANVNNKQFKAYFGATAVYASGTVAANGDTLSLRMVVVRTGAATQRAWVMASSSNSSFAVSGFATPTETLSGAVVVKATGQATVDNDCVQKASTVEFRPVV